MMTFLIFDVKVSNRLLLDLVSHFLFSLTLSTFYLPCDLGAFEYLFNSQVIRAAFNPINAIRMTSLHWLSYCSVLFGKLIVIFALQFADPDFISFLTDECIPAFLILTIHLSREAKDLNFLYLSTVKIFLIFNKVLQLYFFFAANELELA